MSSLAPTYFTIPEIIFGQGLGPAENSSQWEITTSLLANMLHLPDLSTQPGLRKVHKHFDDIHARLDHIYTTAKDRPFPLVMAGVVGLMIKMNVDVLLREKLFERGAKCDNVLGLLQKVMSLLDYDETRLLALQTLLGFTYYEGRFCETILKEVASQNGALSHLILAHSTDPELVEVTITIMAHATESTLDASHPLNLVAADGLFLIPTQASIISCLRDPANYRLGLLTHALQLLVAPTDRFPEECQAVPSLPSLLVAFLGSKDIVTRALSMIGIFNLSRMGIEPDRQEVRLEYLGDALRSTNPQPELFANVPRDDFLQLLEKSYAKRIYDSSLEYLSALTQAARDRDFYALGHKLHILFQQSPSVLEGRWKQVEEDAGVSPDPASPFVLYSDVLPECSRALRAEGGPSDRMAADVIDMKFLLMRNRLSDAITYATGVLERHPRMAFANYVVSLGNHSERSLRAAKEGLQCPDVTSFLREHMLWRSVDLAGRRALAELLETATRDPGTSERQKRSKALLASALEDAEMLIREMAADTPTLLTIIGWTIVLLLVIRGDELTVHDLKSAFTMITTTMDVVTYFGFSINKTDLYLVWELISETYPSSTEEWGALVRSYDELDGTSMGHYEPRVHDGLSTWFGEGSVSPQGNSDKHLLQCSACSSPSAALKVCKGCKTTWYCDADCHASHWETHKIHCQRGTGL